MRAQQDIELFAWLRNALQFGGDFVRSIARAALLADDDNYVIVRVVLVQLKSKYPRYSDNANFTRNR